MTYEIPVGNRQKAAEITLEYLNLDSDDTLNELYATAIASSDSQWDRLTDAKVKALARLDIEHTEKTPLHSWLKAMAERNSLPFTLPSSLSLSDAIMDNSAATRFMFWLA